ncbi:MAG: hypothetical protein HKN20_02720, partial [Gemmatimonadetes bacterium]|nr:hypothetical protein [Gemmatimonadota bacterium]
YIFVLEAITFTQQSFEAPRHVTGQQLLDGIREYAKEIYGPTACMVFAHWGATETLDFGRMVYALIETGQVSKQPEDSLEDFREYYDFKEVFEEQYRYIDESSSP